MTTTVLDPTGDTTSRDSDIEAAAALGKFPVIRLTAGDYYIEHPETDAWLTVDCDPGVNIYANSGADGGEHGWNFLKRSEVYGGTWDRGDKRRLIQVKANGCVFDGLTLTGDAATTNDQIGLYVRQGYTDTLAIRITANNQGTGFRVSRLCDRTRVLYATIDDIYEHGAYFSQSQHCEFSHSIVRDVGGNFAKMQIDSVGAPTTAFDVYGWRCANNYGKTAGNNGWQTNRTGSADGDLRIRGATVTDNIAIDTTGNSYRVRNVEDGIFKNNEYYNSSAPNNTDTGPDPDEVSTFLEESNNTLAGSEPSIPSHIGASATLTNSVVSMRA